MFYHVAPMWAICHSREESSEMVLEAIREITSAFVFAHMKLTAQPTRNFSPPALTRLDGEREIG